MNDKEIVEKINDTVGELNGLITESAKRKILVNIDAESLEITSMACEPLKLYLIEATCFKLID